MSGNTLSLKSNTKNILEINSCAQLKLNNLKSDEALDFALIFFNFQVELI